MKKPLPPQVRRRINKLAHKLALAAEVNIRDRLTAQAYDAAQSGSSPDAMLAALLAMAVTEAELAAMTLTEGELLAMADTPTGA